MEVRVERESCRIPHPPVPHPASQVAGKPGR